jgi:hypothetical protein
MKQLISGIEQYALYRTLILEKSESYEHAGFCLTIPADLQSDGVQFEQQNW